MKKITLKIDGKEQTLMAGNAVEVVCNDGKYFVGHLSKKTGKLNSVWLTIPIDICDIKSIKALED